VSLPQIFNGSADRGRGASCGPLRGLGLVDSRAGRRRLQPSGFQWIGPAGVRQAAKCRGPTTAWRFTFGAGGCGWLFLAILFVLLLSPPRMCWPCRPSPMCFRVMLLVFSQIMAGPGGVRRSGLYLAIWPVRWSSLRRVLCPMLSTITRPGDHRLRRRHGPAADSAWRDDRLALLFRFCFFGSIAVPWPWPRPGRQGGWL